jgi:hypothetical protein
MMPISADKGNQFVKRKFNHEGLEVIEEENLFLSSCSSRSSWLNRPHGECSHGGFLKGMCKRLTRRQKAHDTILFSLCLRAFVRETLKRRK